MAEFPNFLRDGFDPYATISDAASGPTPMWDAVQGWSLSAGRFTGSQCLAYTQIAVLLSSNFMLAVKATGISDQTVIVAFAFKQDGPLLGTGLGLAIQGLDDWAPQWTVAFRGDGAVVVKTGAIAGAQVAVFPGAFTQDTWHTFQIAVKCDPSGFVRVFREGQTGGIDFAAPDFSASGINTRGGSGNSSINRLAIVGGDRNSLGVPQRIDDFHGHNTRGGKPSGLTGDLRCVTLMPDSDVIHQFTPVPATWTQTFGGSSAQTAVSAGITYFAKFTSATYGGRVTAVRFTPVGTNLTIKGKAAVYADLNGAPGALLAVSSEITGLTANVQQTYPISAPNTVTEGQPFWIGLMYDSPSGVNVLTVIGTGPPGGTAVTGGYPAFENPVSNFVSTGLAPLCAIDAAVTGNYSMVNEPQEDGLTTYVQSNILGSVDQYGCAALGTVPLAIDAVVSFGFMAKSDAGTRNAQVELTSGSTVDDSPAVGLTTTFGYLRKCYEVDPNTGVTWDYTNVDTLTVGPKVGADVSHYSVYGSTRFSGRGRTGFLPLISPGAPARAAIRARADFSGGVPVTFIHGAARAAFRARGNPMIAIGSASRASARGAAAFTHTP